MKLSKFAKMYIEELHGAHEYKELMNEYPASANYFKQMHDDELKHASYILTMHPKIKEEIKAYYDYLKEDLEDLEEIITMI